MRNKILYQETVNRLTEAAAINFVFEMCQWMKGKEPKNLNLTTMMYKYATMEPKIAAMDVIAEVHRASKRTGYVGDIVHTVMCRLKQYIKFGHDAKHLAWIVEPRNAHLIDPKGIRYQVGHWEKA